MQIEKKNWHTRIATLESKQPYELVEKDSEGNLIIDEIEMEITKLSENKVKGFFRLGGSAKYWGELFSLHAIITSYERAIKRLGNPHLQVEEVETEDLNFMYIDFSYVFQNAKTIGDVLKEIQNVHRNIKEISLEILINQATELLSESKKK